MNSTTTRPINPNSSYFLPSMTEEDLARILQDDGTNGTGPTLDTTVTGTPSRTGDWVSRPAGPDDGSTPQGPELDPSTLPILNEEIGLWSGEEGTDSPLLHMGQTILPESMTQAGKANIPNGGPDGVSGRATIPEYTREDWIRDSEAKKADALKHKNDHKLQEFDDLPKDNYKKGIERADHNINQSDYWTVVDAVLDWIFGTGPIFYADPEQNSASVADPHAMFDSLIGKGSMVLPDGLGLDKDLIGKMLGGFSGADTTFGDFLNRLEGFDVKEMDGLSALDTFINSFGIDGLNTVLKEFLPHFDLDLHTHELAINAQPQFTPAQEDLSHLLAINAYKSDFII